MQLHLSSWPEVEAYLARSKAILIPIGSTEQHGPTGLLGTDGTTRITGSADSLVRATAAAHA